MHFHGRWTRARASALLRRQRLRYQRYMHLESLEERRVLSVCGTAIPGTLGDLNGDGLVNAADIDQLYAQIDEPFSSQNDLNSDGAVDRKDVEFLVRTILGTELGDADLDGKVGNLDFGFVLGDFNNLGAGWNGGDINGDGRTGNPDFGEVLGNFGFEASPLAITATLANDTGIDPADCVTSDPAISGNVTDSQAVTSLRIGFDGTAISDFSDVTSKIAGNGTFALSGADLIQAAGGSLSDGVHTLHLLAEDTASETSRVTPVTFQLDATPPTLVIDAPITGASHSPHAPVIGTALDASGVNTVHAAWDGGPSVAAQLLDNMQFEVPNSNGLSIGAHQVSVQADDIAGTVEVLQIPFDVTNNGFAFGPAGSAGWGLIGSDHVRLGERNGFLSQGEVPVTLGQVAGTRTIQFDLEANFDTSDSGAAVEDVFLVYLVDSQDRTQTLLDRGENGSALFAMAGESVEFLPGVVRYDGETVEINVTSLSDVSSGTFVFQLLNSDADEGTSVAVSSLANTVPDEETHVFSFPNSRQLSQAGSAVDLLSYSAAVGIELEVENVRFEPTSGEYRAELHLENRGDPTGGRVVAVFPGLPSDVQLLGASGTTLSGDPYINFKNAIAAGGLGLNEDSSAIEVAFSNPNRRRFSLRPQILTAGPNQSPQLAAIGSLTVMPGEVLSVELQATDADGDRVIFSIITDQLPTSVLHADGNLQFSPAPDQIGRYEFTVVASDGADTAAQHVTLDVIADTVTTTRVTGVVLNTDEEPLVGIPIAIAQLQTLTDDQGRFVLESATMLAGDTLFVSGDEFAGPEVYPSIAEKLHLLLGREVFEGVNNVIPRPIYLPALDVENAQTIDPNNDVTVSVPLAPNEPAVELFVSAGSLQDQQGNPFTGQLSITEVPRTRTPAALPANLFPDVVVTIQPGEMDFAAPAKITFPNRSFYAPGELMDLWSIDPVSGEFEIVGQMQVSADGSVIETISGGIESSSWHAPTPRDRQPRDEKKEPRLCMCPYTKGGLSDVEMLTGTFLETHELATYQSLGATRGVSLRYDSARANPQATFRFSYDVVLGAPDELPPDTFTRLVAKTTVDTGGLTLVSQGLTAGQFGLDGGENLWDFGELDADQRIGAALQMDLRSVPTGVYPYELTSGFMRVDSDEAAGRLNTQSGQIVSVNSVESPFGSGWGLEGWQEIVEHEQFQDAVLLVDGDGTESMFIVPFGPGLPYQSPPGDFSKLEKINGRFRRTLPDQTVYQFNDDGKLETITDRNGNVTRYDYDSNGNLVAVVDPVGMETRFNYVNGKVASITDPAQRTTELRYNTAGDLARVVNPDDSDKSWGYDANHLLTSKTTLRGHDASIEYGDDGGVRKATRADGSVLQVMPSMSRGLFSSALTTNVQQAPPADTDFSNDAFFVDANGNVERAVLDAGGQLISSFDAIGRRITIERGPTNLVTGIIDGRGNLTRFSHDSLGNVTSTADAISRGGRVGPASVFSGLAYEVGETAASDNPFTVETGDLNQDGRLDVVTANSFADTISILFGQGDGTLGDRMDMAVGNGPRAVGVADVDANGTLDILVTQVFDDNVRVLLGMGDGNFQLHNEFAVGTSPVALQLADVSGDNLLDIVTANDFDNTVSVLIGDGTGNFASRTDTTVGMEPGAVQVVDVNGDERPDIIAGNFAADSVTVLLNEGNTTFGGRQDYSVGDFGTFDTLNFPSQADSVAVGDLNGDTVPDIVTADRELDSLSVLFGIGDGSFAARQEIVVGNDPIAVAIADLDADGNPDVVAARHFGEFMVVRGNGQGDFGTPMDSSGVLAPSSLRLADMNADGNLDAVSASFTDVVSVLFGQGDGTFASTYREFDTDRFTNTVKTADINGDGVLDLITANAIDTVGSNRVDDTITVLLGQSDGNFSDGQNFIVGDGPRDLAIADLNDDQILDVVTGNNEDQSLAFLPGFGDGTFGAPQASPVGRDIVALSLADLNQDDKIDAVTANWPGNTISILLGNGDGTFGAAQHLSAGSRPVDIALANVTDDEQIDIIVVNNFDDDVSVFPGLGDGSFGSRTDVPAGNDPEAMDIVDFNADGQLDILIANGSEATARILLGRADGGFDVDGPYRIGRRPVGIAGVDVNGDQLIDIVSANSSATASVLLAQPGGSFGDRADSIAGDDVSGLATGDFNQDGFTDIALATAISGTVLLNNSSTGTGGSGGSGSPRVQTYDPIFNQLKSTIDELGRETTYDIDPSNGNVRSIVQPGSITNRFTFTGRGQFQTHMDALGRVTEYLYDPSGRTRQITLAKGTPDVGVQKFEYDDIGNQTAFIDENNNRTEFEYDDLNRLTLVRDALMNETVFRYDDAGNIIETEDARGNVTRNEYDRENRLVSIVGANGQETRFTYDNDGNLVSVMDPLSNKTTNRYDARRRLILTRDPEGGVTRFGYDGDGNLKNVVDPVGNATTFVYDSRDRLIREIDALGNITKYNYDAVDNLIRKTDRNRRMTEFVYDDLNRLEMEVWGAGANTILYDYDAIDNLLSVNDAFTSLTFTYDARDRSKTVDNAGTLGAPNVVLTYGYDPAGNVTSVTDVIDGELGAATVYRYDALNRSRAVEQSGPSVSDKAVDFIYNEFGLFDTVHRFSDLARANPVATSRYQYDSLNRLDSLRHTDPANNVLALYDFRYDAASRIRSLTDVDGVTDYSFDGRDQLTDAERSIDDSRSDESYRYDENGNRASSHLHANYNTGGDNRLLTDGVLEYEYDDEGNTIRRKHIAAGEIREFQWDHRDRLVEIIDKDPIDNIVFRVSYRYDGLDRRIAKTANRNGDQEVVHFVYDRADVILTSVTDNGVVRASFVTRTLHGPEMDQILAEESGANVSWYLPDHLGSIRDIVDHTGVPISHIAYDSFGNVVADSGNLSGIRYRFTGREWDDETGYYYFRARYLDAEIGRFLNTDPTGLADGFNPFTYVGNNPTSFVDPTGLFGENVHQGETTSWATDVGIDPSGARAIGDANIGTDSGNTGPWPWSPRQGGRDRHFDLPLGGEDSRFRWSEIELENAVNAANSGDQQAAWGALGRGLHSLQDMIAHRDWNNEAWRSVIPHWPWYDWWDLGYTDQERKHVEDVTKDYLREFLRRTRKSRPITCQKVPGGTVFFLP